MRTRRSRALAAALAVLGAAVQGCGSGSAGSDVGQPRRPPIARALLVTTGETNEVREGAEVLLTGRDSEDPDGPIIDWKWTAPEGIELLTRSRAAVSFTAPDVDSPTTFTFSLEVVDSDGVTATAPIDVRVVPARDPDRFLAPRGVQTSTPDLVTLTAALEPGTAVGPLDVPFTVTLTAAVSYPSRSNVQERVELPLGGQATMTGHWPAEQTVECSRGQRRDQCLLASWINPTFHFRVPRLDVAELNQRFLASGELGRQLDPHRVDEAVVEVTATLDAGTLQDRAVLLLSNAGAVIAETAPSIIGVRSSVTVTTGALLAALGGEERAATADAYYRTVDPFGRRQTLNDWLLLAGFAADANGTLLPEAVAGSGPFAHAKYTNNFDLGFGRDMYARVEPNGNVYSLVVNYPTLEATLKGTDAFVTVVMEFTPPDDPALHPSCATKGRFVKFFTYVPDRAGNSRRVGSFDFDGRGERYTPGNCVTCHGGSLGDLARTTPNPSVPGQTLHRDCGDTDGTFLPWDLDSFLYSDTDPAILAGAPRQNGTPFAEYLDPQGRYRRDAQEEQFRKLNAAALSTWETYVAEGGPPERMAAAIDLVRGWYGGDPHAPGGRFDGTYTPAGWNVSPPIAEVYHQAFARYCRACHLQLVEPDVQLATYQDLVVDPSTGSPRQLEDILLRRGIMPYARLTMDRFWVPFAGGAVPAEVLARQLAADVPLDPAARPGRPVFNVTRTPSPAKHGDAVRLSARDSLFVRAPRWSALAATAGGPCVQPALVGARAPEVTFQTSEPGRYCIELESDGASVIEEFEVLPNQAPQLVAKPRLVVDERSAAAVDFAYTDADDGAADLVFTLLATLNGVVRVGADEVSVGAQFTQPQIDAGEVQFEPRVENLAEGAVAAGGFDYALTDGIASVGAPPAPALGYRMDVRGTADATPAVLVRPVPPSELYFGGTVAIGAGHIEVRDADTPPEGLTVTVAPSAQATGSVTPSALTYRQLLDGAAFTYTHAGNAVSERLLVTAGDGTYMSSSVPLTINARVSFEHNITPIIETACADNCHAGGPLSFRERGRVSHANVVSGTRLVFPESACIGPDTPPSSPLLRKPTVTADAPPPAGHAGGVRPGFDLSGDRSGYDLFRLWLCHSYGAND